MKNSKILFRSDANLFIIQIGTTLNAKIAKEKESIIQTLTFSKEQFNLVKSGAKFTMQDFYNLDSANCLDCPFAKNNGCYTAKPNQYKGFLSMLRSIKESNFENIPLFSSKIKDQILAVSFNKYVRFGTYGEPSLLPLELVKSMAIISKSWTGYTHQYKKEFASGFNAYFMASAHNEKEAFNALKFYGYRSFIAKEKTEDITNAVQCPASKELSKTTCSTCGLCSGINGKGKKDVKINLH